MIETIWLVLCLGCIGWYLLVLGYVAVKGAGDIKRMLAQLSKTSSDS